MERFWEICKAHPLWVGGGVLFLVIIFMMRGNSSSAAQPAAGIYDITQNPNVVAANAAQATAQNNANAAVSIAQIQAASADRATAAAQEVQDNATNAQATTMGAYFTSALQAIQAQYGAMVTINGQNTTAVTEEAQISATAQVNMNNTNAATTLALQENQNDTNITLAGLGLDSQNNSIMASITQAFLSGRSKATSGLYDVEKNAQNQGGSGGGQDSTGGIVGANIGSIAQWNNGSLGYTLDQLASHLTSAQVTRTSTTNAAGQTVAATSMSTH